MIANNLKKFLNRNYLINLRKFHEDFTQKPLEKLEKLKTKPITGAISVKYDIFRETDSPIILDIDEERAKILENEILEKPIILDNNEQKYNINISFERGTTGVFEINELVEVLRKENAENIFVCKVSKEIKYVDYMCIVSGRSRRHVNAIGEFVRKIYKIKRYSNDILPKIEGGKNGDWIAMDLGNIALHIFASETRKIYDLESLWSIGPEYDKEYQKPEVPIVEMYEKHSIYLSDLTPKQ